MARTIRFTVSFRQDDTLTDFMSAVLSDSGAVYGIKRLDTSAVVTAANTAMTHDSTGRYSYTLSSPVVGVTYRASMKLVLPDGQTVYRTQDKIAGPESSLIDYSKFVRKYTNKTLTELTNREHTSNVTTPDDDLLYDAFAWAEAKINSLMSNGRYQTPLEFEGAVDPLVEEWAMVLAFSRLYYDRFDDSVPDTEIEERQQNQSAKIVATGVSRVLNEMAMVNNGFAGITGATVNSDFDLMPTLLTQRDVDDAARSLVYATSRNGIWVS